MVKYANFSLLFLLVGAAAVRHNLGLDKLVAEEVVEDKSVLDGAAAAAAEEEVGQNKAVLDGAAAPENHVEKIVNNNVEGFAVTHGHLHAGPSKASVATALLEKEGGNATTALECNKRTVLRKIRRDGARLVKWFRPRVVCEELLANKEVVLAAVKENGVALKSASRELKCDKDVVGTALKKHRAALRYACEELQRDREFIASTQECNKDRALAMVKADGRDLIRVCQELRANKEVVLAAVGKSGKALQYASTELKCNKDVVLMAVRREGLSLEYACEELKANKEVVLAAVGQNGLALDYASTELKCGKDVVLAAVKDVGVAIKHACEELKCDKDVVRTAVKENPNALRYACEELRANKEVVLAAVGNYGTALEYASKELRANKEVVLAAVGNNGYALDYASTELKANKEFVLEAMRIDVKAFRRASQELQNDKEVVLAAVREDGEALNYASTELRQDPEVRKCANEGICPEDPTWNLAKMQDHLNVVSIHFCVEVVVEAVTEDHLVNVVDRPDEQVAEPPHVTDDKLEAIKEAISDDIGHTSESFEVQIFPETASDPDDIASLTDRIREKAAKRRDRLDQCQSKLSGGEQSWLFAQMGTKKGNVCKDICEDLLDNIHKNSKQLAEEASRTGNVQKACVDHVVREAEAKSAGCCGQQCGWNGETCTLADLIPDDEKAEFDAQCCTEMQIIEGSERWELCVSMVGNETMQQRSPERRTKISGIDSDVLLGETPQHVPAQSLLQKASSTCMSRNLWKCVKDKAGEGKVQYDACITHERLRGCEVKVSQTDDRDNILAKADCKIKDEKVAGLVRCLAQNKDNKEAYFATPLNGVHEYSCWECREDKEDEVKAFLRWDDNVSKRWYQSHAYMAKCA